MTEAVERIRKEVSKNSIQVAFDLLETELRKAKREEELNQLTTLQADYAGISRKQTMGFVTPADEARRREIIYQILVLASGLLTPESKGEKTPLNIPKTNPIEKGKTYLKTMEQYSPEKVRQLIRNNEELKAAEILSKALKDNGLTDDHDLIERTISRINQLLKEKNDHGWAEKEQVEHSKLVKKIQACNNKLEHHLSLVSAPKSTKTKILLVAANPVDTLRLTSLYQELDLIRKAIREGKHRDRFEPPILSVATSFNSLVEELRVNQPQIIHFAGHGDPRGGISLELNNSQDIIPIDTFKQIISQSLDDKPNCIVLNLCHSDELMKLISKEVKFVASWEGEVIDNVALVFATTFYQSLADFDKNEFVRAFNLAKLAVERVPSSIPMKPKFSCD